ncbi:protein of unknown function [Streptomyces murinus]
MRTTTSPPKLMAGGPGAAAPGKGVGTTPAHDSAPHQQTPAEPNGVSWRTPAVELRPVVPDRGRSEGQQA